MAYYNRKPQLTATLNSIKSFLVDELYSFGRDDFEIVIVDDGSDEEHILDNQYLSSFGLNIEYFRIKKEDKSWCNPCVPFNIAFSKCSGDIVVIQNPECVHFGNILEYSLRNIEKNHYISYACFSADPTNSKKIQDLLLTEQRDHARMIHGMIDDFGKKSASKDGQFNTWYNHSLIRPMNYHFCSAIRREDLFDMSGFDENYSFGVGYDDDEFLYRLQLKGMSIEIIDNPFVIHQYHPGFCGKSGIEPLVNNYSLFHTHTKSLESHKIKNRIL